MSQSATPTVPDAYDGTGELPDSLAFVTPSRTDVYLLIREHDGLTASEIGDRMDVSSATVYRCLRDLEAIGLVESRITISFRTNNPDEWVATDGETA